MTRSHSDALVFFGATGDLAYKKIFPALQAMVKRGHLNVPVIGVAKAGWNLDQLRGPRQGQRRETRRPRSRGLRQAEGLLRYVDGDYSDPATFQGGAQGTRVGRASGALPGYSSAACSRRSWSSSPSRAAPKARASSSRSRSATISLRRRNSTGFCSQRFPRDIHLSHRPLPGQAAGAQRGGLPLRELPSWSRSGTATTSRACKSPWRKTSASQGRGAFYDQTGTIRDVIQNHLFQIMCNLAMEASGPHRQRIDS